VLDNSIQDRATLATAYPGAADDLAHLPPNYRNALDASLKRNANEVTVSRADNIQTLRGLKIVDPQRFASMNLAQIDLPASTRLQLMKEQTQVAAKLNKAPTPTDTAVQKALGSLQGQQAIRNLQLAPSDRRQSGELTENEGRYWQFVGALEAEVDAWSAAHGNKPPAPGTPDMNNIIASVTATVGAKKGWGWFHIGEDRGHPVFEVPKKDRDLIVDAYKTKYNREPTESEIGAQYRRQTRGR
jgi:hypothetical protein